MNYTYAITPRLVNNFILNGNWYSIRSGNADYTAASASLPFLFSFNDGGANGGNYQVVDGQVYRQSASKAQLQMTERMGGLATVRMAEFDDFLGSLWHGERLAFTLALLSTVVALACIHVAGLAAEDAD